MTVEPRCTDSRIRLDVQGLRAVAVLFVVGFHDELPLVHGGYVGVDVFFVISGFVITGSLLRRDGSGTRLSLVDFYLRRVRRIMPAAAVTILVTVMLSLVLLDPLTSQRDDDPALPALTFWSNWWFLGQQTNYLSAGRTTLFDHYWSLSVEEQIYIVWPVTLLALLAVARRSAVLIAPVAAIAAVSLGWCVLETARNPITAFYATPARAWEFLIGGLIALALNRREVAERPIAATACTGIGLAMVVAAGLLLNSETAFPGRAAVLPTVGAGLVILGGFVPNRLSRMLAFRPFSAIGDWSYSIYLWHWPLIVLVRQRNVAFAASVSGRLVLLVASVAAGALSFRMMEDPVRRADALRRSRAATVVLASVCLIVPTSAWYAARHLQPLATGASAHPDPAGSTPHDPGFVPKNLAVPLARVETDRPIVYDDGCHLGVTAVSAATCAYGDTHSPTTVFLVGDSSAAQWFPAMERVAEVEHLRLISDTKSSCPLADITFYAPMLKRSYAECRTWQRNTLARITRERPTLVVVASASSLYLDTDQRPVSRVALLAAEARSLNALTAISPVLFLGDTPHWSTDPAACLAQHLQDTASCARPRAQVIDLALEVDRRAAALRSGTAYFDPIPFVCASLCPMISGNQVMYVDRTHLSASFDRKLAEPLRLAVSRALRRTRASAQAPLAQVLQVPTRYRLTLGGLH